jgi:hypothetical protein
MEKLQTWLLDNPIQLEADVDFLRRTVEHHRQACQAAQLSTRAMEESLGMNWTGKIPYLRLIHCVVDDFIKQAHQDRNNTQPGRMEVENRNSEKNVWEKLSDLWNNPEFQPETLCLPDLHPHEFQPSINLASIK